MPISQIYMLMVFTGKSFDNDLMFFINHFISISISQNDVELVLRDEISLSLQIKFKKSIINNELQID